jgi:ubiquinone/menaquinone biosynthesis C-methylase UbiE
MIWYHLVGNVATVRVEGASYDMPRPSTRKNTYIMDAENAAEIARLSHLHRLIASSQAGLLPDILQLSSFQAILDIASGPGDWVLDMASCHPNIQVTGIDISPLLIEYATARALEQGLTNAHFCQMDAMQPLAFTDHSFDLVHARHLYTFMLSSSWPQLMRECVRVTRPGGIICLTEAELTLSNSETLERFTHLIAQALQRAGLSFSPDGRHIGITPRLGRFLRDAGCHNIRHVASVLNYSSGEDAYSHGYQYVMAGCKLIQPFLLEMEVAEEQELERMYHLLQEEVLSPEFCGLYVFVTSWGEVPA